MLKFFDANQVLGYGIFFVLDPGSGMKKFGSMIYIPDPQHCKQFSIVYDGNMRKYNMNLKALFAKNGSKFRKTCFTKVA
jgi:hypothetical protein